MNNKTTIAGLHLLSIINIFGRIFIILSIFEILPFLISIIYSERIVIHWGICIVFTALLGLGIFRLTSKIKKIEIRRRESFVLVSLSWFVISVIGAIPFLITKHLNFVDAYFEVVSGFTTTGASLLTDIEALPKSLLLWRSQTQWIGGVGIIVMFIAIFPLLKNSKMSLFTAEASVIVEEKTFPRFVDIARWIGFVYFLLSLFCFLLLLLGEMDWYDSINHTFTTLSTGGYSTKNTSIANYSAYSQYVISLFMIVASISFSTFIFLLRRDFHKATRNEEVKTYLLIIGITTIIATIFNYISNTFATFENAFRHSLFQIASIISTTGFITSDYTLWAHPAMFMIVIVMFIGGCSGSTAGGIKVGRILLFFKNFFGYIKKLLHPQSIVTIKFNGKNITEEISNNTMVFVLTYLLILFVSTFVLTAFGIDTISSFGAVISSLGNIGPAFGIVGPVGNFASLPSAVKLFLSFLMIVGRLEIFTVLILFTKNFWKS